MRNERRVHRRYNSLQNINKMAKKYYFISNFNGTIEVTKERYENLKRQFIKGLTCSEDKIQQCVDHRFKEVDEDDV